MVVNIAIVEDDPDHAGLLVDYVKKYERETGGVCNTRVFGNAIDFLSGYTAAYDVVFMDIEMPMMNGMTAAKKLRELDGEVCLIFITAMSRYALKGTRSTRLILWSSPSAISILPVNFRRRRNFPKSVKRDIFSSPWTTP